MDYILVTGGCGFIASNFINYWAEKYPGDKIVTIDRLDYCSSRDNIKCRNVDLVIGDITDKELLCKLIPYYNFDACFHFAAQSHVDNSFEDPLKSTRDNVLGTHTLLEAFRLYKPNVRFVHFSTDEVYGENTTGIAFDEQTPFSPTNPYSASKAAAEMIVNSYIIGFEMDIKIIRCNNVYGPNQYHDKLIPKFMKLIKEGKKCTLHGQNSSKILRAFIHVEDVCRAVEIVFGEGTSGQIYNISSDYEISVFDLTMHMLKNKPNPEDYIEYVQDRPFNDSRYLINSDKLKSLGWSQIKDKEFLLEYTTIE